MDQQQPQDPQHPQPEAQQPPPPAEPGWAPPPSQPQGGWGPGNLGAPQRPTGVTLGSIFLIVMGVLWLLGGAACAIGGGAIGGINVPEMPGGLAGALGGALLVFGIIALAIGILQIAAGAGAMAGKGWGRVIGMIVSIVAAIIFLLGGLSALGEDAGSAIFTLLVGVLYALTAWVLIKAGPYFAYRR